MKNQNNQNPENNAANAANETKKANAITLMIIDESGSMMGLKRATEESHMGILQKIKLECEEMPHLNQYANTWLFEGIHLRECQPLTKIEANDELKPITLIPKGSTPLFDAIGKACTQLEMLMNNLKFPAADTIVNVALFTDGEENSSTMFTQSEIKRLITRLKTQGWTFDYYGTDTSVEEMKERLAFDGGMRINKTEEGFREGMASFAMKSRNTKLDWMNKWWSEDFKG